MRKSQFLVVTDSADLFNQVKSALLGEDVQLFWAKSGQEALAVLKGEAKNQAGESLGAPDLLVCDMQIGSMGGIAICYDLYLETAAGRVPQVPVILLLDREADIFLAKEIQVEGYILKPIDFLKLKRMARELLTDSKPEISVAK